MKSGWIVGFAACASASILAARASAEPKYLNRSIYMTIELVLCEHLERAVLYQDDQPVSAMPARRVFQFTYYPDLKRLLPEAVQLRVEGFYLGGREAFVAKLAVSPNGIHTAHQTRAIDTEVKVLKQRRKIDVRLEPRTLQLQCERFCKRTTIVASNLYQ